MRGPTAAGPAIVDAVRARDPRLPAPRVVALADDTRIVLFPQRAAAIVTGGLGLVGLLLAALGLYGTVAASVARRTREIGVRLALGAGRGEVLRTVVGEGAWLALGGVAVGLPLAALAMPLLRQWLFEIDPRDPATYAALSLGAGGGGAGRELPAGAAGGGDRSAAGATDRLRRAGAAARANAGGPAGAWRRRRADSAFQACDSNSSATPGWPAWRITAAWPGCRSSPHAAIIMPLPVRTASSSRPSPRT